jgi:hypothetical protein
MKVLKLIASFALAASASAAFAVAPVPGAVDAETGKAAGFVQTPWSVANYGLMPQPKQVAGFTAQPWSVERSTFYKGDTAIAGAKEDASRGRL